MVTLKVGTRPPWVGLGASVWLQIASGNAYVFPLYSHSLKSVLGFNQHQITMLGVANDVGENFGLLPGIVCNKFPPWIVLLIGSILCFFGYGIIWITLTRTINSLPYWLLWLSLCIATNSSSWLSTVVLVTNMRNFPLSRGTVAGIFKGYGGLSAAVFTEIYGALLHRSSSKILMFLSLGVPVLCIIMMYFIKFCTPASDEDSVDRSHFVFIQAVSVILGVYLLTATIMDHFFSFSASVSSALVIVMVVLLMTPLAVPIKMTFCPKRGRSTGILGQQTGSSQILNEGGENTEKTEPLLKNNSSTEILRTLLESEDASEMDMLLAEGAGAVKKKRRPRRGENFNFHEAIVKADFWLLFFAFFLGVGSGITVLNNLAQIGIAQGIHDTTILLSLFSFFNFVGRLGGGVVSEHFVRSKTIPRTTWMTCTQVIMIVAHLLFASALDGTLYAATALLGFSYGVQFSTMVPTVSELFGLKYFGLFYNFMSLGNPLGAFLFSGILAGYIYDNEAAKQHNLNVLEKSISCFGPHCFRLTFYVLAAMCGVGSIFSIILTVRIRPVYQMLYDGGSFRSPQTSC